MPANAKVIFKFGTRAQYDSLASKLENALYFLTDTGELYRGTVPFGQAHVYSGARLAEETDNTCIARLLDTNTAVVNDLVVITNADNTVDTFIYSNNTWIQLNSRAESSAIAALDTRLDNVEDSVADLEALLYGTPEDVENNIPAVPGISDRVSTLENTISTLSGAFHFKGTVADIEALEEIVSPTNGDVYQVGSDEYAWNGNAWVRLGGEFDLSNYVTTSDFNDVIGDLEALIGHAATTREEIDPETGESILVPVPATGVYDDLMNHAADIIPLFNGTVAGLVPVATGDLDNAAKANLFMNALGNWVNVNTSGGQTIYTDPENNTYTSVEEYVTYMLENHNLEWSAIAE